MPAHKMPINRNWIKSQWLWTKIIKYYFESPQCFWYCFLASSEQTAPSGRQWGVEHTRRPVDLLVILNWGLMFFGLVIGDLKTPMPNSKSPIGHFITKLVILNFSSLMSAVPRQAILLMYSMIYDGRLGGDHCRPILWWQYLLHVCNIRYAMCCGTITLQSEVTSRMRAKMIWYRIYNLFL